MYNEIIRTIKKESVTAFILKTKGDDLYWYLIVDNADLTDKNPVDFVNGHDESDIYKGFSEYGFETIEETIEAIG